MATARNQEKDFGKNGLASDKRFVKGCKLVLDPLVVKVSTIQERPQLVPNKERERDAP